MNQPSIRLLINNKKKAVILIMVVMIGLGIGFSLTQSFEYASGVKLLVIQGENQGYDSYTAAKSAERFGHTLTEVIYTTSFFDKVMTSGFNLVSDFSEDEEKKRKEWTQKVEAQMIPQTSILEIKVYDEEKHQAEEYALAIAHVLSTKGNEYYVGDNELVIKTVDAPLTSKYPVRPNIPLNVAASFIVGACLSGLVLYREKRKIYLGKHEMIGEQVSIKIPSLAQKKEKEVPVGDIDKNIDKGLEKLNVAAKINTKEPIPVKKTPPFDKYHILSYDGLKNNPAILDTLLQQADENISTMHDYLQPGQNMGNKYFYKNKVIDIEEEGN